MDVTALKKIFDDNDFSVEALYIRKRLNQNLGLVKIFLLVDLFHNPLWILLSAFYDL